MLGYITRRLVVMIGMTFALSLVCFLIIQLPPGDVITAREAELAASGDGSAAASLELLREQYGLDQPVMVQYWRWISGVLHGDLGYSLQMSQPVSTILKSRMGISIAFELICFVALWAIAVPIGIYSAVRRYSVGDMFATIFGFIGLAVPNFLLALVLMYSVYRFTGQAISGLYSAQYADAPWSLAKLWDFLCHVWLPVVVIATGGAAHVIRTLRANLLDELNQPYVMTARAKGVSERKLILRYPVRVAMIPLVATVGWVLPAMISSSIVTAIVTNLPTLSPILLRSLLSQDMYLAGALILMMGMLTLIGTLISDLLLAWIDPRIRLGMTDHE